MKKRLVIAIKCKAKDLRRKLKVLLPIAQLEEQYGKGKED